MSYEKGWHFLTVNSESQLRIAHQQAYIPEDRLQHDITEPDGKSNHPNTIGSVRGGYQKLDRSRDDPTAFYDPLRTHGLLQ